ncbi:hypothetical protein Cgig2_015315 [Carnegiea gigantea]|uniref:Uncharacterized protein n=1 Tax=Carnegiea gigantea TaxID=171969 RepID=A0A9Q1Q543_9CARY|nr:hypothetical protein Cgig2_015315 [Carnegiea gigantea]
MYGYKFLTEVPLSSKCTFLVKNEESNIHILKCLNGYLGKIIKCSSFPQIDSGPSDKTPDASMLQIRDHDEQIFLSSVRTPGTSESMVVIFVIPSFGIEHPNEEKFDTQTVEESQAPLLKIYLGPHDASPNQSNCQILRAISSGSSRNSRKQIGRPAAQARNMKSRSLVAVNMPKDSSRIGLSDTAMNPSLTEGTDSFLAQPQTKFPSTLNCICIYT